MSAQSALPLTINSFLCRQRRATPPHNVNRGAILSHSTMHSPPHLRPELWLSIFTHLDDPVFLLRTCRTVSRTLNAHVKTYFKSVFIPKRTVVSVQLSPNPGLRSWFSHYSPDSCIAYFAVSQQSSIEVFKSHDYDATKGPRGLYLSYCGSSRDRDGRNLYGFSLPSPCRRLVASEAGARAVIVDEAGLEMNSEDGAVRLLFDAERKVVGFVWWEVVLKVLLHPMYDAGARRSRRASCG
jgi:hypothetical protein